MIKKILEKFIDQVNLHLIDLLTLLTLLTLLYLLLLEIYSYYRLKETPFLNLIFTSLSTKKNSDETLLSYLNFEEFVIIIWDFLSQEPALYAFNKFSKSKSDYLSFDTIRQMLSMILDTSLSSSSSLPPSPNLKKNLESILEEMDVGVGRNISSADFNSFIRENKSLISPLRRAQTQLRTQIIGEVYWKSVTDIRKIKLPGWTVLEIISRREDEIDANQVKITL